jgi:N-acetylmuramoyl-L-alanine amidase
LCTAVLTEFGFARTDYEHLLNQGIQRQLAAGQAAGVLAYYRLLCEAQGGIL